jgi:hypothetical protein
VVGAEPTGPLAIKVMLATNVFVIGEPIPVVVEVTNRGRFQVGFTWQVGNETSSGINIEMTHLENRRQLQFMGHAGGGVEGWIKPSAAWMEMWTLHKRSKSMNLAAMACV